MAPAPGLTLDHQSLADNAATRLYLAKIGRAVGHLTRVAAEDLAQRRLSPEEAEGLVRLLTALVATFRALGHKFHFAGRAREAAVLTFDRVDSGFPVAAELMEMAADATQAACHLRGMPSADQLKDEMVKVILAERQAPKRLQFALSQRLYYEELAKGGLFHARNDPEAVWLGATAAERAERRRYLLRWGVFEATENLPVIYLMTVEDTGRVGLPKDGMRWPLVQRHLMAQAVGGLTLLTIARGFDADFADLHPKRLRRFRVGPLRSAAFTSQPGAIYDLLSQARAPEGEDWALEWTEEDLVAERAETERSGWFGSAERQIFRLSEPGERGLSALTRSLVLPARVGQTLAELDPPALRAWRRFVVGEGGRLLPLR